MSKIRKITGYTLTTLGVVFLLAIFAMSLPIGGWRALSVQTGSMAPAIKPGALVLVQRVPETSLQVGDVITYANEQTPGTTLTHRIVDIKKTNGAQQIIVKGDANNVNDAPIAPSQVVGKVAQSIPGLGRVSDFVRKPLGLALLVYLPALLIVIYELKLLIKRLTKVEVDKIKTSIEAEKIPEPMPLPIIDEQTKTVMPVKAVTKRPRRIQSLDGLRMIMLLSIASLSIHTTQAALNTKATLTGTTISTAAITQLPPNGGTSCSSSNAINVTNTTNQTAASGSTSVSNSTNDGTSTTGDASNTSTTNTTVIVNTGC